MNKKKNSLMRETRVGIAFLLPALIPLMVFWMLPVFLTVGLSFTKWDMISPEIKWVGIKNYVTLFKSANFFKIIKNTFVFSVGATIPNILMGLILALVLVNSRRGAGFYRTMMFVPYITPMVAASIIWSWLYDPSSGFFNYVSRDVRLAIPALPETWAIWTSPSLDATASPALATTGLPRPRTRIWALFPEESRRKRRMRPGIS